MTLLLGQRTLSLLYHTVHVIMTTTLSFLVLWILDNMMLSTIYSTKKENVVIILVFIEAVVDGQLA